MRKNKLEKELKEITNILDEMEVRVKEIDNIEDCRCEIKFALYCIAEHYFNDGNEEKSRMYYDMAYNLNLDDEVFSEFLYSKLEKYFKAWNDLNRDKMKVGRHAKHN